MGGLQPWHWVIVIAVFVLLFGAKKLPELSRSLGQAMSEFKKGVSTGAQDESVSSSPAAKSGEQEGGEKPSS